MKVAKAICVISLGVFLLVGSQGTLWAEGSSEPNTTNSEPNDPNMTKWGPKLSEEELAAIAKLSTLELLEMVENGETLHAYAALRQLKADDGLERNFDLLLSIAAETRGDMIVEGLVRPIKKSAGNKEKRIVDKFLDFLEAQLKKDKPSVSRRQAVRSIAQTVHISGRPGWRRFRLADPNKLEVPYANDRVISILTSCLDSNDWQVRLVAVGWLGEIGANDLKKSDEIIASLNAQFAKEEAIEEKEPIKARRKEQIKQIKKSLRRLNRKIDYLRKGLPEYYRPPLPRW